MLPSSLIKFENIFSEVSELLQVCPELSFICMYGCIVVAERTPSLHRNFSNKVIE